MTGMYTFCKRDCDTCPSTFEEVLEGGRSFVLEEEVDEADELAEGRVDKEEV